MNELLEYVYHGREERNLEYKQTMPWGEKATKEKITKIVLAMSNLKEGGIIVIGVKEKSDGSFEEIGMDKSDVRGYRQDFVSSYVNKYADPFAEVSVDKVTNNGKEFVVIQISPFKELPVICKKGSDSLRRGAIYIRPRRMIETAEVSTQTEMREIIELAIDKNIELFKQRFHSIFTENVENITDRSLEKFNNELGDF